MNKRILFLVTVITMGASSVWGSAATTSVTAKTLEHYQLLSEAPIFDPDSNFVAPTVTSTANVTDPTVGLIVYDATAAGFYGRAANASWTNLSASNVIDQVVIFQDQEISGTAGGTFTTGAWTTRTLNAVINAQTWASLSANQITLAAGTYEVTATAPAYAVHSHQAKFTDVTDSIDYFGSSEFSSNTNKSGQTTSTVNAVITIGASKTFELYHQCAVTEATDGFGVAGSFATEVYSQVKIRKLQ